MVGQSLAHTLIACTPVLHLIAAAVQHYYMLNETAISYHDERVADREPRLPLHGAW